MDDHKPVPKKARRRYKRHRGPRARLSSRFEASLKRISQSLEIELGERPPWWSFLIGAVTAATLTYLAVKGLELMINGIWAR